MKAVGLVVEYNPFHNGHKYHLQESKKSTGANVVIAVMSGSFLQRGEPALTSKWTRTNMALKGGADLVVELPYAFSTQHAEPFALGSIKILEALHCEFFCFGSELGEIAPFKSLYQIMSQKEDEYNERLKFHSSTGKSYPKSASLAFLDIAGGNIELPDLSKPNNILGYQYVRTALKNGFSILPATIKRIKAEYHDDRPTDDTIASATSIRSCLFEDGSESQALSSVMPYLPKESVAGLDQYVQEFGKLHQWEDYWQMLKYKLISSSVQQLAELYEVEEGIEYRLKEAALEATSFHEFVSIVKTKRYTWTRIQRICVHILNHVTKNQMTAAMNEIGHIRILGMSATGQQYLSIHKKTIEMPLYSKLIKDKTTSLALDYQSATIHALSLDTTSQQTLWKRELQAPIRLKQ
ncbi:nucleotidyltransferase [Peribacillus alkalitolerans]|uniref:nucleotidyltransferase n=1 Tax=Peribacillus alkalitolerans TaxID=1550385 RepID=UPI0013D05174|nr:nucleotidyltransferase [Peribacillus alkalitolerans]